MKRIYYSLIVALCITLVGCDDRSESIDNIVIITIDTWRHDASGFSGAGRVQTPALDRIAARGRVFDFAHAHAVVTLPSHASILTGLYPYEHGIRDNAGYRLGEQPTLASMLAAEGWETAAFVSAFPLDRRFGLDHGFSTYDDDYEGYGAASFTPPERPGDETVAAALRWWKGRGEKPRMMWVHLFTPHYPYDPGPRLAAQYRSEPYFGDVARADEELAPLVEELLGGSDADSTAIILTSDHGEGLGDHGEQTHGLFAYESTLRVPLVLVAPGWVQPSTDSRSARHIDIVPTLLELANLPVPERLRGRSLHKPASSDPDSYFEALSPWLNRGWAPLTGNIAARNKAIRLPIPELFDLGQDPEEGRNLAPFQPQEWEAVLRDVPPPTRGATDRGEVDAETASRLQSLGYAAQNLAPKTDFGPQDDPKSLLAVDDALAKALAAYAQGRSGDAIKQMRELIELQPQMSLAYAHLSYFYSDLGRVPEAIATLKLALDRGAATESLRRKLALALMRVGEPDEAWLLLQIDRDSEDPETQTALGRIATRRRDAEEAARRFERALQIDSTFPAALMDSGILLMELGRFEEARPRLEAALERDEYLAEAWNALGVIESASDPAKALAAWERAVEIDPRLPDALFNLGIMYRRAGQREKAIDVLTRYLPLVSGEALAEAQQLLDELQAER